MNGYFPLLVTEGWQVAFLNSDPNQEFKSIRRLDRHLCTDEAFCLLEGRAWLIEADETERDWSFSVEAMRPSTLYNIPTMRWHNIVLDTGTKVLIVEKDGSHLGNFEFRDLGEGERAALRALLVDAGMEASA